MIHCLSCERYPFDERVIPFGSTFPINTIKVNLISKDALETLPTDGSDVVELPNSCRFAIGSKLFVVNGEFGSEVYTYGEGGFEKTGSVRTAIVSGTIVTFVDGKGNVPIRSLKINIVPQQDLHGYDAPWAEGGRGNLVDKSTLGHVVVYDDYGHLDTYSTRLFSDLFPVEANTDYYISVSGTSSNNETILFNRVVFYDSNKDFMSRYSTNVVTRATATFRTDEGVAYIALDLRTQALTTDLNPSDVTELLCAKGTTAIPYYPYSNICPITGWTGSKVVRTGKNILDISNLFTRTDLYTKNADGSITVLRSDNRSWANVEKFFAKAGTYSFTRTTIEGSVQIRTSIDNYSSNVMYITTLSSGSFTVAEDCYIAIKLNVGTSVTYPHTTFVQLEVGSTATDYEPYNNNSTTIQVDAPIAETDTGAYLLRPSGGGKSIGEREYDSLVGGTVVWNQLNDNSGTSNTVNGVTYTKNSDGSWNISGTSSAESTSTSTSSFNFGTVYSLGADHVYFALGCPTGGSSSTYYFGMGGVIIDQGDGGVWKNSQNYARGGPNFRVKSGVTVDFTNLRFMIIDLTQMFGSTIADYIYNLEQSNTGAGVAWFRNLFPKDWYEYNSGTLISVNPTAHKMVGFNQFDKDTAIKGYYINDLNGEAKSNSGSVVTDYIQVVPNETYYINSEQTKGAWGAWYDANKNYISGITGYTASATAEQKTKTAPSNARYMRLTVVYYTSSVAYGNIDTFCVNISSNHNGLYEQYTSHAYPLNAELRGIPKLDENNQLYYDGDTYEADGTVTRKYGIVTFTGASSERWNYNAVDESRNRVYIKVTDAFPYDAYHYDIRGTYISPDSGTTSSPVLWGAKVNSGGYLLIGVPTTITSADAFKTYLASNPLTVLYELATPTTETADGFEYSQVVDKYGTEEYVDERSVAVPVGHVTRYPITVYGGVLDVVSGELAVDRVSVDLGTLNWLDPISANPNWFRTDAIRSTVANRNILCSHYGYVLKESTTSSALNNAPDKSIAVNKGDNKTGNFPEGMLLVKDSAYSSATAFKTAMSGVQFVYELNEPITYHLTPEQIPTLKGQNTIFTDTDDNIEVEYVVN